MEVSSGDFLLIPSTRPIRNLCAQRAGQGGAQGGNKPAQLLFRLVARHR